MESSIWLRKGRAETVLGVRVVFLGESEPVLSRISPSDRVQMDRAVLTVWFASIEDPFDDEISGEQDYLVFRLYYGEWPRGYDEMLDGPLGTCIESREEASRWSAN